MRQAMRVGVLCAAVFLLGKPMAYSQTGNFYQGTLWAGQFTDAGSYSLTISDDCGMLSVVLVPDADWEIAGYHFDIVSDPGYFPLNGPGNPKLGLFQWSATFPPTGAAQAFDVLIEDVIDSLSCGQPAYVAVQAVMVQRDGSGSIVREETAWGGPNSGDWDPGSTLPGGFFEFPGNRWDYYLTFLWNAPPTPTPTPVPPTPTFTPVPPTPTFTPVPPTPTPTPIPPTPTATMTPTPLPPTPTPTPLPPTPTATMTPTPLPPTPTPTPLPPTPTATMTPTPLPPTPTPV